MNNAEQQRRVVATGNFDGLHLGHRKILDVMSEDARLLRFEPLAVTYEPHTRHFLTGYGDPLLLTPLHEKQELFRAIGVPLEALAFDAALSCLSGIEYVRQIIIGRFQASVWVFGPSHRFGAGGKGDLNEVRRTFPELRIIQVAPMEYQADALSSSRIRAALVDGDLELAAAMLGRPYSLQGTVVAGDGRGRTIGVPTANLEIEPLKMLPSFGVYSGTVDLDGTSHLAVVNIGVRPTFQGVVPSVEVHLPDWSGDLYGKTLEMKLNLRLRGEMRFTSAKELVAQITCDVQRARSSIQQQSCT